MAGSAQNIFPEEYGIIRKLGTGGTAEIYLAERKGCNLPVALKLFRESDCRNLIDRELIIARNIRFPGFVRVKREGRSVDGRRFIETEYCPGQTLDFFAGKLSEKKLLSLLSALSCELYVLHQHGFVYNDLKPGNIFAPPAFENDQFDLIRLYYPKLNDFSLSRRYDSDFQGITGTVGYMSPEMILRGNITPASDLFSLGILAYFLACGRMPFSSDTNDPVEINAQVTEGRRPSFSGPGLMLSEELKGIIKSLIEIEPAGRPTSAFELTEMLARAGSSYPFRNAVRPSHLLSGFAELSDEILTALFGEGSFSDKHLRFIENSIGFERRNIRLLLDYNFDRGNFARLDRHWGWRNEGSQVIEWSSHQSRLNLRILRGKPLSFKRLAIALAIIGHDIDISEVASILSDNPIRLNEIWQGISEECRPALLYSLNQAIDKTTCRIISHCLIPLYENDGKQIALLGRLYLNVGKYERAARLLASASEDCIKNSSPDGAFEYLDLALSAAFKLNNPNVIAELTLQKARYLKNLGRIQAAEEQYREALSAIGKTNLKELLARAYKEMGDIYKAKSDYNSGIEALYKALAIYRQLDDQLELSHTLNNLGNIYWTAGELDEALNQYQQALDMQIKLKSDKDIASTLSNLGSIYVVRGDYPEGIKYLDQSLEIKEKLGNKGEIARSLNNLGVAHFLAGRMGSAIDNYLKSLELNREINDLHEQLLNIENLAEAMTQAGRIKQALEYIKEGLRLAEEERSDFHRSDLTRLTGQLLRRMGHYEEAESKLGEALEISQKIDNKSLQLACTIGAARLHQALREFGEAEDLISKAIRLAESLGDKSALLYLALLQLDSGGDDQFRQMAEKFASELNTARDSAQLYLTLLELSNRSQQLDRSKEYLFKVGQFFGKDIEDIDQARYEFAAGQYHFLAGEMEAAQSSLKAALEIASNNALLPEQWRILALLSEIYFENNDFEESFSHAQRTLDVLKLIAKKIGDRERLGRLYNDQRIIDLLGRIKSLQTVLGNKKGAAVSNP